MINIKSKLDEIEKNVFATLKDFQRATVERIDELYRAGQKRILVSDEVGLGKTLVAKGVIVKFAKFRKEKDDDLVKIVYICSNINIAEQNLHKLKISKQLKNEASDTQRLSMQHLNIFKSEHDNDVINSYVQLIPLTPDTSFKVIKGQGQAKERALMYVLLCKLERFSTSKIDKNKLNKLLKFGVKYGWSELVKFYDDEVSKCNNTSHGQYLEYMKKKLNVELDANNLYQDIIEAFSNKSIQKKVIGKLRVAFAKISLEKLKPDLVIMDEFQRFKELLDAFNEHPDDESKDDSDLHILTRNFFNREDLRILLLSATPYKMYSTLEEIDESHIDSHYEEFFDVIKFLNNHQIKNFEEIWTDYSIKLKEFTNGKFTLLDLEPFKSKAEEQLYNNICRTERFSEEKILDVINDEDKKNLIDIKETDINSYVELQELIENAEIKTYLPIEYVKSSPYLMSFMQGYKLKEKIENKFKSILNDKKLRKEERFKKALKAFGVPIFWIKKDDINKYKKIDCNNGRLEKVMQKVLPQNFENLLWIPPSKPYYELQGAFKDFNNASKTLIFSAWEMVPKMIACMVSYEAERRSIHEKYSRLHKKSNVIKYFAKKGEKFIHPKLVFSSQDSRGGDEVKLQGLSLFTLLYPSKYLTKIFNPKEYLNKNYNFSQIKERLINILTSKLEKFPNVLEGGEDKKWYYLMPFLLDDKETVENWFKDISQQIQRKNNEGFFANLQKLEEQYEQYCDEKLFLGKRPSDLMDVLVDIILGSPAICLNRTFGVYENEPNMVNISKISRAMFSKFNSEEAIAIIDFTNGSSQFDKKDKRNNFWKKVLCYCRQGNLQAVFDEYVYFISRGLDRDENFILNISNEIRNALSIGEAQYTVDTYKNFRARIEGEKESPMNLRSRFAVTFSKAINDENDGKRKANLRNAFNSPFRPFVLASTSIGQEGLDFHAYCRRIVHWNLPHNPIDFEQREGRINRFMCLAIRQNVAKKYGSVHFDTENIWEEMFNNAKNQEKKEGTSDLIPYWGLRDDSNLVKIERILPMYPFSRDIEQYEKMIKILSLYRLTLGQARQAELLEYIIKNNDNYDKFNKLFMTLSPYYKEKQVN